MNKISSSTLITKIILCKQKGTQTENANLYRWCNPRLFHPLLCCSPRGPAGQPEPPAPCQGRRREAAVPAAAAGCPSRAGARQEHPQGWPAPQGTGTAKPRSLFSAFPKSHPAERGRCSARQLNAFPAFGSPRFPVGKCN